MSYAFNFHTFAVMVHALYMCPWCTFDIVYCANRLTDCQPSLSFLIRATNEIFCRCFKEKNVSWCVIFIDDTDLAGDHGRRVSRRVEGWDDGSSQRGLGWRAGLTAAHLPSRGGGWAGGSPLPTGACSAAGLLQKPRQKTIGKNSNRTI